MDFLKNHKVQLVGAFVLGIGAGFGIAKVMAARAMDSTQSGS